MGDLSVRKIEEIKNLYNETKAHVARSIETVIKMGELLTDAKSSLDYGQFKGWVEENFEFSYTSANKWMKVYENKKHVLKELKARNSLLLSDAYNAVSAKILSKEPPPKIGPAKRAVPEVKDIDSVNWKSGGFASLENHRIMAKGGQVFVHNISWKNPIICAYLTIEQRVGAEEAWQDLHAGLQAVFEKYYAALEELDKEVPAVSVKGGRKKRMRNVN